MKYLKKFNEKVDYKTNLEKFIEELKESGEEFKHIKMLVPSLDKEVDFILCLFDNPISNTKEINEYVYGLDSTLEEMEEIEFWVQEDGGANLLARSIGLVDNHYTF
jgi:hypothetical protein